MSNTTKTRLSGLISTREGASMLIAGGLLFAALMVAIFSLSRVGRTVGLVKHTYLVIAEVNHVIGALRDAETDQRAYLITGDETLRRGFEDRLALLERTGGDLLQLTSDNDVQQKRIARMIELIKWRARDLREIAGVRRDKGFDAVAMIFLKETSVSASTVIREAAQEVTREELALLDSRQNRLNAGLRSAVITIIVCGCLAVIVAGHNFWVMRRAQQALQRESTLLKEKEKAEEVATQRSEFLANMSHEIRTPMNAVLGFTDLLRGVVTTYKQRQYVDAIHTSGGVLLELINDILDLSKIEAGKLEISRHPTSIRATFDKLATIFRQQARERGLKLAFEVDDGLPPAVLFDAIRLRQILFNVIGNALKFTPQGSVKVRAWSEAAKRDDVRLTLFLSVADTGIGISNENREIIFEPFRQVRSKLSPNAAGTGLGLSITKRLTGLLGGTMSLDTSPGRGSTFTFAFPEVEISAAVPEEDELPADADLNHLRPSLILVADDMRDNRELLTGIFDGSHHRLIHAATGQEAIDAVLAQRPDLVLMDIRMPGLDGREALTAIRGHKELAGIPVIAVTASNMTGEEEALRDAFDGFLRKPFTRAALFSQLLTHLPPDENQKPSLRAVAREPEPDAFDSRKDSPEWTSMTARFGELERTVWPALIRSMGYREMETFALEIETLAAAAHCKRALSYARKLLGEVRAFEIDAQEKTLREFPGLAAERAPSSNTPAP